MDVKLVSKSPFVFSFPFLSLCMSLSSFSLYAPLTNHCLTLTTFTSCCFRFWAVRVEVQNTRGKECKVKTEVSTLLLGPFLFSMTYLCSVSSWISAALRQDSFSGTFKPARVIPPFCFQSSQVPHAGCVGCATETLGLGTEQTARLTAFHPDHCMFRSTCLKGI